MSTTEKYYVGDVGTVILVNTGVDLSAATVTELLVRKPGATSTTTWTGTVETVNGSATYIKYTTQSGDFSVAGTYKLQAHVHVPSWVGLGETTSFRVYEAYK